MGTYVSLVRDFSRFPDMESISICDFPIFGDPYDKMSFEINVLEYLYFTVDHADYTMVSMPEVLI